MMNRSSLILAAGLALAASNGCIELEDPGADELAELSLLDEQGELLEQGELFEQDDANSLDDDVTEIARTRSPGDELVDADQQSFALGIPIPCFHAPKPSLRRAYATDSIIKVQVTNACPNTDSWKLYRAIPNPGALANWWLVDSRPGTGGSHYSYGLEAGRQYCYRAEGKNSYGTAMSDLLCVTTLPPAGIPADPTSLHIDVFDANFRLRWIDHSNNETGFVVRRTDGTPSVVGTVDSASPGNTGGAVSFTDVRTDLGADRRYCYDVYATNPTGNSVGEAATCVYTRPSKPPTPTFTLQAKSDTSVSITTPSYGTLSKFDGSDPIDASRNATGAVTIVINGLQPATQYCATIGGENASEWPDSPHDSVMGERGPQKCVTTPATPEPEPIDFHLIVHGAESSSGLVQYAKVFDPAAATGKNAYLHNVRLSPILTPTNVVVKLLKAGKQFSTCGSDPSATVRLTRGQTMTAAEMTAVFGSTHPPADWVFIACAAIDGGDVSVGATLTQIVFDLTYTIE